MKSSAPRSVSNRSRVICSMSASKRQLLMRMESAGLDPIASG